MRKYLSFDKIESRIWLIIFVGGDSRKQSRVHVKSPVEVHKLAAGTFSDIEHDVKNDNKAKKLE